MSLNVMKVSHKLWLIISTLISLLIIFEGLAYTELYRELIESRKHQVHEQVDNAHSLISHYAKKAPEIGEEAAKKQALEALSALRFGNNGYFWVNDMNATLLMHPHKPQLHGKNMSQVTDANGKRNWQEMVDVVKKSGEGYVEYAYQGPQVANIEDKVSYVKGYKPWGWIVGTGAFYSDLTTAFWSSFQLSAITQTLIVLAAIALSAAIVRNITRPLEIVTEHLQKIANGDLTQKIDMNRQDEIGILGNASNQVSSSLSATLSQVANAISELKIVCKQMSGNSKDTQQSIDSQFAEVEALATAMNEMSHSIKDVALHAKENAEATQTVQNTTRHSNQDLRDTNDNIQELTKHVRSANDVIDELLEQAGNIDSVVSVIGDISEQTNLLALNAAIEAARAGETGRGFAVVADEVRSLASRTQDSTVEIREIIEKLQQQSKEAANAMISSAQQAEKGSEHMQQASQNLEGMLNQVDNVSDRSMQIASSAEQQDIVAEEINQNVTSIRSLSEQVLKNAEQVTGGSQTIADMSEALNQQINQFKFN